MPRLNHHSTRCIDGRLMRHDPQYDDPHLETDIGQCEECEGQGCEDGEFEAREAYLERLAADQ